MLSSPHPCHFLLWACGIVLRIVVDVHGVESDVPEMVGYGKKDLGHFENVIIILDTSLLPVPKHIKILCIGPQNYCKIE